MENRTLEAIHAEYAELCKQAGHLQYQIEQLTVELQGLTKKRLDLNLEASALSKPSEESKS